MDRAVRTLVEDALRRASAILQARRDALERGAALLLAKETLLEEDLKALAAPAQEARVQAAAPPSLSIVPVKEPAQAASQRDA
jgi:cell division protease FtsH